MIYSRPPRDAATEHREEGSPTPVPTRCSKELQRSSVRNKKEDCCVQPPPSGWTLESLQTVKLKTTQGSAVLTLKKMINWNTLTFHVTSPILSQQREELAPRLLHVVTLKAISGMKGTLLHHSRLLALLGCVLFKKYPQWKCAHPAYISYCFNDRQSDHCV